MPDYRPKVYLGDSVYAYGNSEGIQLFADDNNTNPTDKIYLDWHVLKSLNTLADKIQEKQDEQSSGD